MSETSISEKSTSRVTIEPAATARTARHTARVAGLRSSLALLAAVTLVVVAVRGAASETPAEVSEASQGWQLWSSGLWVGGFVNNTLALPDGGPDSFSLADAGLLLRYEVTPTISLFNETDLDEALTWEEGSGVQRGSRVLLLERLYADWQPRPEVTIRLGKFLTPFGLWNVVRRAPLTWTVEPPLITDGLFPDHITGAAVGFQTTQSGWTLDGTGYGQATDELYPGASDTVPSAAGGGRVSGGRPAGPAYLEAGLSGVAFKNENSGIWQDAVGTDFSCTASGIYLQAELAYARQTPHGSPSQWGLYVQGAFPVFALDKVWGVLRFEHFDPTAGAVVNGGLVGLAWRPLPWLFLKGDYQLANHSYGDLNRGFFGAVVIFF